MEKDTKAAADSCMEWSNDFEKEFDRIWDKELSSNIDTEAAYKLASHFVGWQMLRDVETFSRNAESTFDPNYEPDEATKKAATAFAYDLDAYLEGEGPNISDVINGFYGGVKWVKGDEGNQIITPEQIKEMQKFWYLQGWNDKKDNQQPQFVADSDEMEYHPSRLSVEEVEHIQELAYNSGRDSMKEEILDKIFSIGHDEKKHN